MRLLIVITLACLLSVPLVNYLIDPYNVFQTDLITTPSSNSNDRYNKARTMLSLPRKSVWLMGSSSVAHLPITTFPGDSVLNMGVIAARANEHLAFLQLASKHSKEPEEVYLGIDLFPFITNDATDDPTNPKHEPNLSYLHPPEVTGQSPFLYWLTYLFASSSSQCSNKVFNHYSPTFIYHYDQGFYQRPILENKLQRDPESYIRETFSRPIKEDKPSSLALDRFSYLIALHDWATAHNLKLVLYYQPIHANRMKHFTPEFVNDFKRSLRELTGLNPIDLQNQIPEIDDNRYWFEDKHYRPELATIIYAIIHNKADGRAVDNYLSGTN
jgi:hypothetical protein